MLALQGSPFRYCADGTCYDCATSATCPSSGCWPTGLNAAKTGCVPCRDPNCERCTRAPGQCEFCRPGFYKLANGTCAFGPCTDPRCRYCQVKGKCDRSDDRPGGSCQAGFYANAAGACVACPLPNCICTNSQPKKCGKCFKKAGHADSRSSKPCAPCADPTCLRCEYGGVEDCQECAPGLGLLMNAKTRKHSCQGNMCTIANCEACGGMGSISTNALKECPWCIVGSAGPMPAGGKCNKCKSPICEQCYTYSGKERCRRCIKGYKFDYDTPDSVPICVPDVPCASGAFLGGKCVVWQMNDPHCIMPVRMYDFEYGVETGVPEFCELCDVGFVRTANYTCQACTVKKCMSCRLPSTPGGPTYCSQCLPGFGMKLTATGVQTCQACPAGCKACQWVGAKVECLAILESIKYRESGAYFLDDTKKVAVPCADKNCFRCDLTPSSCNICKLGFVLKKVGSVYTCTKFP